MPPVFVDEMPTERLSVPGEPDAWIEIRVLSWKELEECRRERRRKFMGQMQEMPTDLVKVVGELEAQATQKAQASASEEPNKGESEKNASDTPEITPEITPEMLEMVEKAREENRRREEIDTLDRELLVTKSVVGWSYERHFQSSLLAKLDEKTFTWLFATIAAKYVGDDAQRKADSETSLST